MERGLSLITALSEKPDGATVSELSLTTGLDRAVLYRLLETLIAEGFVRRDEGRSYRLGLRVLEFGALAERGLDIRRLAQPRLMELMKNTGSLACLGERQLCDVVVIEVVAPDERFFRIRCDVGYRQPLNATALGRAMLAFLPDGAKDDNLRPVRERGFAASNDDDEPGTSAVAAPIFNHLGRPAATIGIIAVSLSLPAWGEAAKAVLQASHEISRCLGWRASRRP